MKTIFIAGGVASSAQDLGSSTTAQVCRETSARPTLGIVIHLNWFHWSICSNFYFVSNILHEVTLIGLHFNVYFPAILDVADCSGSHELIFNFD